jgi:hypothetical protein
MLQQKLDKLCLFTFLEQFEDYVRGCTWQLKKTQTIWRRGNDWLPAV